MARRIASVHDWGLTVVACSSTAVAIAWRVTLIGGSAIVVDLLKPSSLLVLLPLHLSLLQSLLFNYVKSP
jgi:hypothetical protein